MNRYTMYERLGTVLDEWPNKRGSVLSISHSVHLAGVMGIHPTEVVNTSYPEVNLTSLPYESDRFDFVVADQVLEHVEGSPEAAIEECRRVLKPGGLVVQTTCFMVPRHAYPSDFWRFTPDALALLCRNFSRVLAADGWGNPFAFLISSLGLHMEPVPHAKWHPMHKLATFQHPDWPVSTWVVAQK